MKYLNVNIDHIATIRQARGGKEPDPVAGAVIAELAGAKGIVCHLREDRRHINDRDLRLLREVVQTKLDLEMGSVEEIIKIALATKPELVTIVPEKRQELTTEGGLDVASDIERFKSLTDRMHSRGIEVSFFIEPDYKQIDAALKAGADIVELHTGSYANSVSLESYKLELQKIANSAKFAKEAGLKVAAGHGLNYVNSYDIALIEEIEELSIGHSIISRAVFVGLERAIKEMIEIINFGNMKFIQSY